MGLSTNNPQTSKRKGVAYDADYHDILDDDINKHNLKKRRIGHGYLSKDELIPRGLLPQSLRVRFPDCVLHV